MPSCDGSNCSACRAEVERLESECRDLQAENKRLRARLSTLETSLESEVQRRTRERTATIRQEAERSARQRIADEIRPEVAREERMRIESLIRPGVERAVKDEIIKGLIGNR